MESPDERRGRFEEIYAANHDPILAYVLRRSGSGEDAADALAETFLTAWRRLEDIPAGDRARLWLFGVARRVLANQRRGERRRSALSVRLRADLVQAIRDGGPRSEHAAVSAAFDSLPERDRELLSLAAWEGLDAGEIAEVLGCSRSAARVRMHRARQRFARELQRQGEASHAQMVTA